MHDREPLILLKTLLATYGFPLLRQLGCCFQDMSFGIVKVAT